MYMVPAFQNINSELNTSIYDKVMATTQETMQQNIMQLSTLFIQFYAARYTIKQTFQMNYKKHDIG